MTVALLPSAYFAPIQWYQKLVQYPAVFIDAHEHFVKQTYRNRCHIAAPDGVQALTVPVERSETSKTAMKDVRISDHGNWRHLHWNALCTAYNDSPFFLYYADELRPFFERKYTFLYDFNLEITRKLCELLDITPAICETEAFLPFSNDRIAPIAPMAYSGARALLGDVEMQKTPISSLTEADAIHDYRFLITPKKAAPDPTFSSRSYYQVFAAKQGFLPNLSIV